MKWYLFTHILVGLLLQKSAIAADFTVTASIQDFSMKSDEPIYRDYYINAGTKNGLKNGAFIDAIRKVPIFDNINSKFLGDTSVRIARLKVIHTDANVSIARLVDYYSKEKTPLTGYDAVMIGDKVEVSEKQN